MSNIVKDTYIIENKKVNKKISVLADIHYWSKKDQIKLDKILSFYESNPCDFICIPGDFINDGLPSDEDIFIKFLNDLTKYAKVVISLGNHDVFLYKNQKKYYKNDKLFEKISNIKNVYLLDNDYCEIDKVRFIGVTLPNDYYDYNENSNYFYRYLNNIYDELPKNLYNVILCHSPVCIREDIIKNISLFNNANLVISGHMHAGVMPRFLRSIAKGKGIISPYKTFLPKMSYGMFDINNLKLVISPGITKFSDNCKFFRLFNPLYNMEIVEIELKK